jgi:hypothetical protein
MYAPGEQGSETELAGLEKSESRLERAKLLLVVVGTVAIYGTGFLSSRFDWFGLFLLGGSLVLACVVVFRCLDWRINQLRRAAFVIHGRSDKRPPILVLRSFFFTSLAYRPDQFDDTAIHRGHSYVNDFARAVDQFGQLIAIGAPGEVTGVSFERQDVLYFQSANATWFEMFNLAAQAARSVILIPGTSPGLMQEVHALISSDSLVKVIVFMPPTPTGMIKWIARYRETEKIAKNWEHMRTSWRDLGLELPAYRNCGMLFVLNSTGMVELSYELDGNCGDIDLSPVCTLLQRMTSPSAPLSEIFAKLERLEDSRGRRMPSILRQVLELIFLGR